MADPPVLTVFISYSWDSKDLSEWVLSFAARLQVSGISTILDRAHYDRSKPLNAFMLKSIHDADFVLVVCTPQYKVKADSLDVRTGVGVESTITLSLFYNSPEKFIPIIKQRGADGSISVPLYLDNYEYFDFSNSDIFENSFEMLLRTLYSIRTYTLPPLQAKSRPTSMQVKPLFGPLDVDSIVAKIKHNAGLMCAESSLYFRGMGREHEGIFPFIEPYVYSPTGNPVTSAAYRGAVNALTSFVSNDKKQVCVLLGDYGSGKTALCFYLCAYFLSNLIENEILPIYLAFRKHGQFSIESIDEWMDALLNADYGANEEYRFSWGFGVKDLRTLAEKFTVVLFLDGFDEAVFTTDSHPIKAYNSLVRYISTLKCKTIITSRPNPFRSLQELEKALFASPMSSILFETLSVTRHNLLLLVLAEFNGDQVEKYASEFFTAAGDSSRFRDAIKENKQLGELAKKPIFLNLLVQRDLSATVGSIAGIYRDIVLKWITTGRQLRSVDGDTFLRIMEEVAFFMFVSGQREVPSQTLEKHIMATKFIPDNEFRNFMYDLETCTFLVRSGDFMFNFSHNTFMEFLVAHKLHRELLEFCNGNIYVRLLTDAINMFLCTLLDDVSVCHRDEGDSSTLVHNMEGMVCVAWDKEFDSMVGVTVPTFFIDRHPVTNREYKEFIDSNPRMVVPISEGRELLTELINKDNVDWSVSDVDGYLAACEELCWDIERRMFPDGREDYPTIYVSYYDCWVYARWKKKWIPRFVEWIKAAAWHFRTSHVYKYGNSSDDISEEQANFGSLHQGPVSIYSYVDAVSPYGCFGMTGNVCEWTADWSSGDGVYKLIAGGAWHFSKANIGTASPAISLPNIRRNFVGIRLVVR